MLCGVVVGMIIGGSRENVDAHDHRLEVYDEDIAPEKLFPHKRLITFRTLKARHFLLTLEVTRLVSPFSPMIHKLVHGQDQTKGPIYSELSPFCICSRKDCLLNYPLAPLTLQPTYITSPTSAISHYWLLALLADLSKLVRQSLQSNSTLLDILISLKWSPKVSPPFCCRYHPSIYASKESERVSLPLDWDWWPDSLKENSPMKPGGAPLFFWTDIGRGKREGKRDHRAKSANLITNSSFRLSNKTNHLVCSSTNGLYWAPLNHGGHRKRDQYGLDPTSNSEGQDLVVLLVKIKAYLK